MRFMIVVLLYCFASASAQACSCADRTSEMKFDDAPIVFVARITKVEDLAQEAHWRTARHADRNLKNTEGVNYGLRMRFEVETVIKGDIGGLSALTTGYGGSDCGVPVMPGGTMLVAVDQSGFAFRCGLSRQVEMRTCIHVLALDHLRARARDGKTMLAVPAESEVLDDGRDIFEDLLESGRNPYSLTTEECPVRLNPSERPVAADAAEAVSE